MAEQEIEQDQPWYKNTKYQMGLLVAAMLFGPNLLPLAIMGGVGYGAVKVIDKVADILADLTVKGFEKIKGFFQRTKEKKQEIEQDPDLSRQSFRESTITQSQSRASSRQSFKDLESFRQGKDFRDTLNILKKKQAPLKRQSTDDKQKTLRTKSLPDQSRLH